MCKSGVGTFLLSQLDANEEDVYKEEEKDHRSAAAVVPPSSSHHAPIILHNWHSEGLETGLT